MEEALTALLLADAGIVAIVGQRITWASRPQSSALPAIVLHRIDGAPEYADEGEVGLFSARVQVDCWAADAAGVAGQSKARQLGRAIKDLVSGYEDDSSPVAFDAIFVEDEQDSFEQGVGGPSLWRVRIDLIVWFA